MYAYTLRVIMIIYLSFIIVSGETEYLANPWENLDGAEVGVGSVSLAFYSGLFAYAGW